MHKKERLVFFLSAILVIVIAGYFLFANPVKAPLPAAVPGANIDVSRTVLDPFDTLSGASSGKDEKRDALRFSNTAAWEPEFLRYAKRDLILATNVQKITLPPPPVNTSQRTNEELELLRTYKNTLRTPERVKKILDEVSSSTTKFGDFTMEEYLDERKFPLTAAILNPATDHLLVLVFSMKHKYDRVRPSVLDSSLDPVVSVPGHPAYPSGHSTQLHFLAYFLSELMPDRAKEFEARADEIAIDREIAGLHYPSDTKAGQMLARQYMDILLASPQFKAKLFTARAEWR